MSASATGFKWVRLHRPNFGGTSYKKWESKVPETIFVAAPTIPVCPTHRWRSQRVHAGPNEEVGAPCILDPQLWLKWIVTAQYLDCISVLTTFGPSFTCTIASKLSANSLPEHLALPRELHPQNPIINVKRTKLHHFMQDIQTFFRERAQLPCQYCSSAIYFLSQCSRTQLCILWVIVAMFPNSA